MSPGFCFFLVADCKKLPKQTVLSLTLNKNICLPSENVLPAHLANTAGKLSFNCLAGMWYFTKNVFKQPNQQLLLNQAASAICFNVLHVNFHI